MRRESEYRLSIGDGTVVLRRTGGRSFTTARILGRASDVDGVDRIWLDRVIAPYGTSTVEGWKIRGAVSSVLERCPGGGEPAGAGRVCP